ncbi:hypothetical protein NE236_19245 [Actinoallomurus purpureus]|uniref:hypothetical protein n=1 Tax=Actinoallomurus purpureus TaxID=478114 RepID=UPI00209230F8|nr:hypothetical protein [Actinoallomurus purpureus]MCO6007121.1 hypothetical protein [Actinoallomurus purpureus]
MRKVGKAAAVALMAPLTAAAIAVGTSGSANAESTCWPFAHATITPPSGSITAGSTVHVSATVSGMLAKAHLQVSGPGLSRQVGASVSDGVISGDVAVSQSGYFTLAVVGNLTTCTYDTSGFSVNARSTSPKPKPTHHKTPSKTPKSGGDTTVPGSAPPLPGSTGTGGVPGAQSLNNNSPFSLPSLAPGGSGVGFQYPTPDPQIAAPAAKQVRADDVSATTPIKWGQSIAAALVLLLLSGHFGMWSRRQRLAAEARTGRTGAGSRGPAGGRPAGGATTTAGRRRRRAPVTESATAVTGVSGAAESATAAGADGSGAAGAAAAGTSAIGAAEDGIAAEPGDSGVGAPAAESETGPRRIADGTVVSADGGKAGETSAAGAATEKSSSAAADTEASPARRGYRGRRRRG